MCANNTLYSKDLRARAHFYAYFSDIIVNFVFLRLQSSERKMQRKYNLRIILYIL